MAINFQFLSNWLRIALALNSECSGKKKMKTISQSCCKVEIMGNFAGDFSTLFNASQRNFPEKIPL